MMLNYKNISRTNKIEYKISQLIGLGSNAFDKKYIQITEYKNIIKRHELCLQELPQVDLSQIRNNIRIYEIMLSKTFIKLQTEIMTDELVSHIALLRESISKLREDLTNAYMTEKRRLLLIAVIYVHNNRCVVLKSSKYIKRIQELIKKKQNEQINLSTIIIDQ